MYTKEVSLFVVGVQIYCVACKMFCVGEEELEYSHESRDPVVTWDIAVAAHDTAAILGQREGGSNPIMSHEQGEWDML
jgi:hypothetical protein